MRFFATLLYALHISYVSFLSRILNLCSLLLTVSPSPSSQISSLYFPKVSKSQKHHRRENLKQIKRKRVIKQKETI